MSRRTHCNASSAESTDEVLTAGLEAVAAYERDHGAFAPTELASAERWARTVIRRSEGSPAVERP